MGHRSLMELFLRLYNLFTRHNVLIEFYNTEDRGCIFWVFFYRHDPLGYRKGHRNDKAFSKEPKLGLTCFTTGVN